MAHSINTGHTVNVENYNQLVINLSNMAGLWNPVNEMITIAALTTHHKACDATLKALNTAEAFDKKQTAARTKVYLPLQSLTKRTVAAMKSCQMEASVIESAGTLVSLITGANISKVTNKRKKMALKAHALTITEGDPATEEVKNRSVSQLAFDARLKNFDKLVAQIETSGNYKTNHADLNLPALKAFSASMQQANNATNDAFDVLSNVRKKRNELLYNDSSSLINRVALIKNELEALDGKNNVHYKKATGLKFVKFKA